MKLLSHNCVVIQWSELNRSKRLDASYYVALARANATKDGKAGAVDTLLRHKKRSELLRYAVDVLGYVKEAGDVVFTSSTLHPRAAAALFRPDVKDWPAHYDEQAIALYCVLAGATLQHERREVEKALARLESREKMHDDFMKGLI